MQEGILVLERVAAALRAEVEQEREARSARIQELERECAASEARIRTLESAPSSTPGPVAAVPPPPERREEMAGALAAAVQRLRARVATVEEPDIPAVCAGAHSAGAAGRGYGAHPGSYARAGRAAPTRGALAA